MSRALAYRAAAHGLHRRERTTREAAAACGITDFPVGAAELALANRVVGGTASRAGLVTSWALRGATFHYPAEDAAVFTLGARPRDERSWKAFLPGFAAGYAGSLADAHARVLDEVLRLLAKEPMTKGELSTALRPRLPDGLQAYCRGCDVVHVNEQLLRSTGLSGAVRVEEGRYVAVDPPTADPDAARAELVRRFLRCYGPATPKLLAEWLTVSAAEARSSWPESGLVEVAEGWLHEDDLPAYEDPPAVEGVRLLGAGDVFLHQRDREVLAPDPATRKRIWKVLGNPGVVLVEGRAVGVWRPRKKGDTLLVTVEPFGETRLPDLSAEAAVVAAARGCRDAELAR